MDPSRLFVLGTSHAVASSEVRERLHVERDELRRTLARLGGSVLTEAVPLVTCARLELYAVADEPDRALRLLGRTVAHRSGLGTEALARHTYVRRGGDAVRHLLRVASGLDSVVHGEAQILGQVRDAYEDPATAATAGPVLHRLFQDALATGKRVRSRTEIGRGAASLASAAVELLRREAGPLEARSALVIGAGDTGSVVASLLRKAGVARLRIANRTAERARELAARFGAEAHELADLPALLGSSDLVVGAVDASERLVEREMLERAQLGGPVHFLDLAHPRNFDPALASLPGVRLFDLDHVFRRVEAARAARATQVPKAEAIVDDAAAAFLDWLRSRDGLSVLRAVRGRVLELARAEAERHAQGRSAEEREELRRFARSLARSLLHSPTVALRGADATSDEGRALLESATRLFAVDAPSNGTHSS